MKVRVETVEALEVEANAACMANESDRSAGADRFTAKVAAEAAKDPHVIVGLLVDFLHKLQSPLLSPHAGDFEAFVAAIKRPSIAQRLVAVRAALSRLPIGHLAICQDLFGALHDCVASEGTTAQDQAGSSLGELIEQASKKASTHSGSGKQLGRHNHRHGHDLHS